MISKKELQQYIETFVRDNKKHVKAKTKRVVKRRLEHARMVSLPSVTLIAGICSICEGNAPFMPDDEEKICHNCSDFYLEYQLLKERKNV